MRESKWKCICKLKKKRDDFDILKLVVIIVYVIFDVIVVNENWLVKNVTNNFEIVIINIKINIDKINFDVVCKNVIKNVIDVFEMTIDVSFETIIDVFENALKNVNETHDVNEKNTFFDVFIEI